MPPDLRICSGSPIDSLSAASLEGITDGIHDAGNPWFDYLFGSHDAARAVLNQWVRRASSEVFAGRCALLQDDAEVVGGFIALSGADLAKCRRSDGFILLAQASPTDRSRLEQHLANAQGLFPKPAANESYLSKLWVAPAHRGKGYAAILMKYWLEPGKTGVSGYRLDVAASRTNARRLYEQFGFSLAEEKTSTDGVLAYCSMVRAGE